ncbi:MAG: glycoside hydrolase family 130 protein [Victivallaceae bacterium]|nr:glycoside hydrolase family 130 protein [Victivallaceae bacterium]
MTEIKQQNRRVDNKSNISRANKLENIRSLEFILKRHPANPILTPMDFPGAESVRNCGQTMYQGKTILLVSIDHRSGNYRGKPGTTTHVAESTDNIHFTINPEPFLQIPDIEPYKTLDQHPIDTRITKIEDTYYIIHPGGSHLWGCVGILGKTKDFKKYEYIEVIALPDNRVPCLFPEKINGKYFRVDRPYRIHPDNFHKFGHLWISSSLDLIHWGCHRPLLRFPNAGWSGDKIGPTPPIKTKEGWLMITHGVAQSCTGHRYRIGAILMDLNNPDKILGMVKSHILTPLEPHEQCGRVPNVVFPCGAIPDYDKDQIRVYYGAADTYICLATGSLSELVDACLKGL